MRTDRDAPLFAATDAPALGVMHRVLLSYIMFNQDLGYSQARPPPTCRTFGMWARSFGVCNVLCRIRRSTSRFSVLDSSRCSLPPVNRHCPTPVCQVSTSNTIHNHEGWSVIVLRHVPNTASGSAVVPRPQRWPPVGEAPGGPAGHGVARDSVQFRYMHALYTEHISPRVLTWHSIGHSHRRRVDAAA